MRLEPIYTVTFTTPEAWSVEVAEDAGAEGRSFLLAEGRSTGRLSARSAPPTFLGSGPTVRSCPSFVACSSRTTVAQSCSSGRDSRYAVAPAPDGCSEASST
jgi:hypothetical protein